MIVAVLSAICLALFLVAVSGFLLILCLKRSTIKTQPNEAYFCCDVDTFTNPSQVYTNEDAATPLEEDVIEIPPPLPPPYYSPNVVHFPITTTTNYTAATAGDVGQQTEDFTASGYQQFIRIGSVEPEVPLAAVPTQPFQAGTDKSMSNDHECKQYGGSLMGEERAVFPSYRQQTSLPAGYAQTSFTGSQTHLHYGADSYHQYHHPSVNRMASLDTENWRNKVLTSPMKPPYAAASEQQDNRRDFLYTYPHRPTPQLASRHTLERIPFSTTPNTFRTQWSTTAPPADYNRTDNSYRVSGEKRFRSHSNNETGQLPHQYNTDRRFTQPLIIVPQGTDSNVNDASFSLFRRHSDQTPSSKNHHPYVNLLIPRPLSRVSTPDSSEASSDEEEKDKTEWSDEEIREHDQESVEEESREYDLNQLRQYNSASSGSTLKHDYINIKLLPYRSERQEALSNAGSPMAGTPVAEPDYEHMNPNWRAELLKQRGQSEGRASQVDDDVLPDYINMEPAVIIAESERRMLSPPLITAETVPCVVDNNPPQEQPDSNSFSDPLADEQKEKLENVNSGLVSDPLAIGHTSPDPLFIGAIGTKTPDPLDNGINHENKTPNPLAIGEIINIYGEIENNSPDPLPTCIGEIENKSPDPLPTCIAEIGSKSPDPLPTCIAEIENKSPDPLATGAIGNISDVSIPANSEASPLADVKLQQSSLLDPVASVAPVPALFASVPDPVTPLLDSAAPVPDPITPVPNSVVLYSAAPILDPITPVPDPITPVPDSVAPLLNSAAPVPDPITPVLDPLLPANFDPLQDPVPSNADSLKEPSDFFLQPSADTSHVQDPLANFGPLWDPKLDSIDTGCSQDPVEANVSSSVYPPADHDKTTVMAELLEQEDSNCRDYVNIPLPLSRESSQSLEEITFPFSEHDEQQKDRGDKEMEEEQGDTTPPNDMSSLHHTSDKYYSSDVTVYNWSDGTRNMTVVSHITLV